MEKQKAIPWWIILTFIGGIGLSYFLGSKFNCNGNVGIGEKDTVFYPQPTYVRVDSFIHDTVVGPYVKVNPHPQIDYDKKVPVDTTYGGYIIGGDGGYRDSIPLTGYWVDTSKIPGKPILNIDERFLTGYPNNPKLIRSQIGKKLTSYTFLLTTGYPRTVTYPMDLDKYFYTWENGEFKAEELPSTIKAKLPKLNWESYTQLTYNPFRNSSRLELNGTINFGKFGITSFVSYTTNTAPALDAGIGTRFKIK